MKTKLIIICSFFISISFAQTQKLSVDMERGSGQDCFGARANCSFSVNKNSSLQKSQEKYLAYSLDEKTLVLEVNANNLTLSEQEKLANVSFDQINAKEPNFFMMDEYFVIDKETLWQLNISPAYNTIAIGQYPMYKKDHQLTIIIPLQKYEDVVK